MNHPRPQFSRKDFIPLDGSWDFAVTEPKGKEPPLPEAGAPPAVSFDRSIRVPYAPEAPLSGIGEHFPEGSRLWYRRRFPTPSLPSGRKLLLHIDGVDQRARIWLNGKDLGAVCTVLNGPAVIDVTGCLSASSDNVLTICAVDDLRDLRFPYGKQTMHRGGMWYTPVSGIWQSIWLEPVPEQYIRGLKIIPSLNSVHIRIDGPKSGTIRCGGTDYPYQKGRITLTPKQPRHWTPEDPFLYRFSVIAGEDRVESYFALRKTEIRGSRILLNGKPFFFHGLLDQGYWPDGLWTPPAADSFEKDILAVKQLGFNTLRKHIKVETEQFYYDCDRLGMIVFQDMINNGHYSFVRDTILPTIGFQKGFVGAFRQRSTSCRHAFLHAMRNTVRRLYNHPCICYWTIFNEGWGQFQGSRTCKALRDLDSTRVIDTSSGWFRGADTDVESRHVYFRKFRLPGRAKKPVILSEFGGFVWKDPEHCFDPDKTYGYRLYKSKAAYMDGLEKLYIRQILPAAKKGLCGAVYTQVSDVEDECNGLLTYDRAVCKADRARMQVIAARLTDSQA